MTYSLSPSATRHRDALRLMTKVSRHIGRTKGSARAYLIDHGYITPSGRLTERYR